MKTIKDIKHKRFFLVGIFILGLFLLIGLNFNLLIKCQNSFYDYCMIGCFSGMNYDGNKFIIIDKNNISLLQIKEMDACNMFCEKIYK